jgi:hypothetical protein
MAYLLKVGTSIGQFCIPGQFYVLISHCKGSVAGSTLGMTSLAFNVYQQWKKLEISIKGAQD